MIWRFLLLATLTFFFLLDRLAKNLVQHHFLPGQTMPVIPDVLHLTYVHNTGVAFSLFQEYPGLLTVITSAFFLGFLIYAMIQPRLDRMTLIIFSLVLGGALGNLWDRLTLGSVVDYVDVVLIHYPVFNLADTFIFIGIMLLIVQTCRRTSHDRADDPQPPDPSGL